MDNTGNIFEIISAKNASCYWQRFRFCSQYKTWLVIRKRVFSLDRGPFGIPAFCTQSKLFLLDRIIQITPHNGYKFKSLRMSQYACSLRNSLHYEMEKCLIFLKCIIIQHIQLVLMGKYT